MLLFLTLRYIKTVSIFFHFLNPFAGYINFVTYRGEKMKVSNISSELKFVNRLGVTLSVEERISIEAQALRLSHEYKHDQWNFWGRIEGIVKNYYIIEGVDFKGVTNFPNRQYFWAYVVLYLEMMTLSLLNYLLLGNSILLKLIH